MEKKLDMTNLRVNYFTDPAVQSHPDTIPLQDEDNILFHILFPTCFPSTRSCFRRGFDRSEDYMCVFIQRLAFQNLHEIIIPLLNQEMDHKVDTLDLNRMFFQIYEK